MIGLSNLLHRSGGSGKEAPLICSLLMFFTVSYLSKFLNYFPTAGLAGIMFSVVLHTFSYDSIIMIVSSIFPKSFIHRSHSLKHRIPRMDAFVLLFVTVITPVFGLEPGIIYGILLSLLTHTEKTTRLAKVY